MSYLVRTACEDRVGMDQPEWVWSVHRSVSALTAFHDTCPAGLKDDIYPTSLFIGPVITPNKPTMRLNVDDGGHPETVETQIKSRMQK